MMCNEKYGKCFFPSLLKTIYFATTLHDYMVSYALYFAFSIVFSLAFCDPIITISQAIFRVVTHQLRTSDVINICSTMQKTKLK